MPAPSAMFSPLTMQTSASSSSRSAGRRSSTRVGRRRRRRRRERGVSVQDERRGRAQLDRHVVARVVRVARERLPLDLARSTTVPMLRRAADDIRADRDRRIGAQLRERDDERRCALRLDVDARAEAMTGDDVRRRSRRLCRRRARTRSCRASRRRRAPTLCRRRAGTRSGCHRRRRRPCGRTAGRGPRSPCRPIGASVIAPSAAEW